MKKAIVIYATLLSLVACDNWQGPKGNDGAAGVTGKPGMDITPVTVVQFCPGKPTYPSTFPEDGICLNGNIYAVYSANDGFLTLLPPGAYLSNAVGSSCDFTVKPNCQVTNP